METPILDVHVVILSDAKDMSIAGRFVAAFTAHDDTKAVLPGTIFASVSLSTGRSEACGRDIRGYLQKIHEV